MNVRLAEHFYSMQGEGPTIGHPALFIRFQKCNLDCDFKNGGTWVCDTQEVMKHAYDFDFEKDVIQDWDKFAKVNRIVFTGGEPMMYQDAIIRIIDFLDQKCSNDELGKFPALEIETNGTQPIKPYLSTFGSAIQYNCSPKLSNSGNLLEHRYNENALRLIAMQRNSIFKFVVSSEADKEEMLDTYGWIFEECRDKVYLMPAGLSRSEQWMSAPAVAQLAMDLGVKFTTRLHILLWDTKKGV